MDYFEVISPGPLTTVQDSGRYGFQQYGVPTSGAMDHYALRLGNLLVGNPDNAPALEITIMGLQLRVMEDTIVAITGADLSPVVNKTPVPQWQTIRVHSGDLLAFPRPRSGARAYLSVSGGFKVQEIMCSASTYSKSAIGGIEGRALRKGDRLQTGQTDTPTRIRKIPDAYIPQYEHDIKLRVIIGPQEDRFTAEGLRTFLHSTYTVSSQADRMGYRLEGTRIEHLGGADIISDGIPLGAVQVPGDGLPIILLADRQTTGGYAKIATVISIDIPKIAQCLPGDRVTFREISLMEAHNLLKEQEQLFNRVRGLL